MTGGSFCIDQFLKSSSASPDQNFYAGINVKGLKTGLNEIVLLRTLFSVYLFIFIWTQVQIVDLYVSNRERYEGSTVSKETTMN